MFISIDQLGKDFRKKPAALDDVTLDLPQGMIGLLGSNGAGKTTLMRILCGIIQPTRGRVLIDGHDLADAGARRAVKKTLATCRRTWSRTRTSPRSSFSTTSACSKASTARPTASGRPAS